LAARFFLALFHRRQYLTDTETIYRQATEKIAIGVPCAIAQLAPEEITIHLVFAIERRIVPAVRVLIDYRVKQQL
jgi:hypothetical protein